MLPLLFLFVLFQKKALWVKKKKKKSFNISTLSAKVKSESTERPLSPGQHGMSEGAI